MLYVACNSVATRDSKHLASLKFNNADAYVIEWTAEFSPRDRINPFVKVFSASIARPTFISILKLAELFIVLFSIRF